MFNSSQFAIFANFAAKHFYCRSKNRRIGKHLRNIWIVVHCTCTKSVDFRNSDIDSRPDIMPGLRPWRRTRHTVVGDLEVRSEIPRARLARVETGDGEPAAAESARTHRVHLGPDVGRTAKVTVVAPHTAAEPHPTVQRRPDDCHFRSLNGGAAATVGVDRLQLTEVSCCWNHTISLYSPTLLLLLLTSTKKAANCNKKLSCRRHFVTA